MVEYFEEFFCLSIFDCIIGLSFFLWDLYVRLDVSMGVLVRIFNNFFLEDCCRDFDFLLGFLVGF